MNSSSDWQTSKHLIAERGQHLIESGEMADCKFLVGEEDQVELEGHKLFLAIASPVFKAMFYGSMAEDTDPIIINDIKPGTFKDFLKYIYTDTIKFQSLESASELLYCAKKYMLPYLVKKCTEYLGSHLSTDKVCKIYELAKLYEEHDLEEKCLNMICDETTAVLCHSSWGKVKLDTLLTIFGKDQLHISSEIELLAAAERWAKAQCLQKSLDPSDPQCLRSMVGNALTKIRFLTLTTQNFGDGINNSLLLTEEETLAIFMNITLTSEKSSVPMPEDFSTTLCSRTTQSNSNHSKRTIISSRRCSRTRPCSCDRSIDIDPLRCPYCSSDLSNYFSECDHRIH